ncbi:MAG TPA: tyrosine-type recombinase/integrase [Isosphaeraceae bacterium]
MGTKHNSEPFWRESKGCFYCWIDGRQRSLGKKKQAAWAKYRELLSDRKKLERGRWSVRECLDYYLEHAAGFEPNTLRNRRQTFDAFCAEARVSKLPAADLTIDHVEAWVKSHSEWSLSTRRSHINAVTAAFNHCVKRKKIRENPVKGIEKPRWERRKEIISSDDQQAIYDASSGPFRAMLTALRETGARPSELCNARVEHYRDGMIVLEEHKEDEHVELRTIHLTPALRSEVEALIGGRESGPIWRNSRGEAWTPDTIYCRFKRLRDKLGLGEGVYPYSFRHRFASDAINDSDANPAVVAKLLGHAGMETLMKNYFRENPEAAQKALAEIRKR